MGKNTTLILLGLFALAFLFFMVRGCGGGGGSSNNTVIETTSDTTNVNVPDTGFHESPIPVPEKIKDGSALIDSLIKSNEVFRQRYYFYKAETARMKNDIDAIIAASQDDNCDKRDSTNKDLIARLYERIRLDDETMDALFSQAAEGQALNSYRFTGQQPGYEMTSVVDVQGRVIGHRYRVDRKVPVITNTVSTTTNQAVKKNSLGAFVGGQVDGGNWGQLYGLYFKKNSKWVDAGIMAGYLPNHEAAQASLMLNFNF